MNMPTPQHPFKSRHFLQSLGFAVRGIGCVLRTERNFQTHVLMAVLVVVAGTLLNVSHLDWILLILSMALMMVVETLNTAIEYLVDMLAGDAYSEKAKQVKDISAGACLITATAVGMAGLLIFLPHLLKLILKF